LICHGLFVAALYFKALAYCVLCTPFLIVGQRQFRNFTKSKKQLLHGVGRNWAEFYWVRVMGWNKG